MPEFRRVLLDRKSTRLNSSHTIISYAVFCLKKKKTDEPAIPHLLTPGDTAASATPERRVRSVGAVVLKAAGPAGRPLVPGLWFFFFNDTAPPEIYPVSLPDPLPI